MPESEYKRHDIFKSGIHKNDGEQVWPPERVRGVLDATRRLSPELIPYTLLHPKDNLPIFGFARKDSIEGRQDAADYVLSAIPEKFAKESIPALIRGGLNKVSIGLGKNDEIVHIGLVPDPAVDGLGTVFSAAPVPTAFANEVEFDAEALGNPVQTAFGVSWKWSLQSWMDDVTTVIGRWRDREIERSGVEEADKFIPAYMMDFLKRPLPDDLPEEPAEAEPATAFSAAVTDNNPNDDAMGMTDEEKKEFQRLKDENTKLKADHGEALTRAEELEQKNREREVTNFISSVGDRVPPSMRDAVTNILLDLQGLKPRMFSTGGGKTDERTSFDVFKDLLTKAPVQVVFSEVATADVVGNGKGDDTRTLSQRADAETAAAIERIDGR